MIKYFILLLCSASFLFSCGRTYRLLEEDYQWMPYKGSETLVFKSTTGETDTIFLLKKDTLMAYAEPQSISGPECEVLSVYCRHSDPSMKNDQHRYLQNRFFSVEQTPDGLTVIDIRLLAKDAVLYRRSPLGIDSLDKVKPLTLQTAYGRYDDVYVIAGEDYLGTFRQRSNFVTKAYWSKSHGLVRYDKDNGICWELLKKQ
jgi:hypothetical protein